MNISLVLPQSRAQSVASTVLSRLKSLVSPDRDATGSADARPYSFLSECECPADCLRDHENE
ncbi:MAG: hypothetical protein EPO36_10430 [Chloroflexota bacterium]|nr:MAG: hypothetical protein EPO36_10430 [Chloroflexota bacterium]